HTRGYLARLHLKTLHASATTIQRHVRGHQLRAKLARLATLRAPIVESDRRLARTRDAIVRREREMRAIGVMDGSRVREYEEERRRRGAIEMQRIWRGWRVRRGWRVGRRASQVGRGTSPDGRGMQARAGKSPSSEVVDEGQPTGAREPATATNAEPDEPDFESEATLQKIYDLISARLTRAHRERLLERLGEAEGTVTRREDLSRIVSGIKEAHMLLDEREGRDDNECGRRNVVKECRNLRKATESFRKVVETLQQTPSPDAAGFSLPTIALPNRLKPAIRASHLASLQAARRNWWEHVGAGDEDADEVLDFTSADAESLRYY
ncbi:hypothetical protein BDK51DRAFT_42222, partial [Blyttiomyces helicus]